MGTSQAGRFFQVYIFIVAINIGIYILQVLSGVDPTSPRGDHLIAWGANYAPFTLNGQGQRLFTSMFLHGGLLHLALNMYMLVQLGGLVERTFGHLRFTLVYVLSGLFGGLASALWNMSLPIPALSVGASGALMGITGALLAHVLVAGARGEQHEVISLRGPLAQTIAINLGLGFMIPQIDNAAHVGGLVSGALLGGAFALAGSGAGAAGRAAATATIVAASLALLYALV